MQEALRKIGAELNEDVITQNEAKLLAFDSDAEALKCYFDLYQALIADLRRQVAAQRVQPGEQVPLPLGFVASVSKAAKDKDARDEFYHEHLGQNPVRGGFVAHRFFVRFVKGARKTHEAKFEEATKVFKSRAHVLVEALKRRDDTSFLTKEESDLESPQSFVASQLLAMALDAWENVIDPDGVTEDEQDSTACHSKEPASAAASVEKIWN